MPRLNMPQILNEIEITATCSTYFSETVIARIATQALFLDTDNITYPKQQTQEEYLRCGRGRGRAALKQVLHTLSQSETLLFEIDFPHPRYSISHQPEMSIAVGLEGNSAARIGVDLESQVPYSSAALHFLTRKEQDFLMEIKAADHGPLLKRLWTIKEAAYKADPNNRNRLLKDYEIHHLDNESSSLICLKNPRLTIRTLTLTFEPYCLTVALSQV
jgi:phosphopantetheinyl transferase